MVVIAILKQSPSRPRSILEEFWIKRSYNINTQAISFETAFDTQAISIAITRNVRSIALALIEEQCRIVRVFDTQANFGFIAIRTVSILKKISIDRDFNTQAKFDRDHEINTQATFDQLQLLLKELLYKC